MDPRGSQVAVDREELGTGACADRVPNSVQCLSSATWQIMRHLQLATTRSRRMTLSATGVIPALAAGMTEVRRAAR